MNNLLISLSVWLHALATAVMIGYFLLSSLIFAPILGLKDREESVRFVISEISRRSRRWMYISLVVFILTGVYLMLIDPNYRGIGDFSNPWAVLMLVKHILVLILIGLGFVFNGIFRIGPLLRAKSGTAEAIGRYRLYSNSMAVLGALILLLTAMAQLEI